MLNLLTILSHTVNISSSSFDILYFSVFVVSFSNIASRLIGIVGI